MSETRSRFELILLLVVLSVAAGMAVLRPVPDESADLSPALGRSRDAIEAAPSGADAPLAPTSILQTEPEDDGDR